MIYKHRVVDLDESIEIGSQVNHFFLKKKRLRNSVSTEMLNNLPNVIQLVSGRA